MENKFNEEEFTKLKQIISEITTHLPEHYIHQIWGGYVKITGQQQPTPCTCASSGGLWANAVKTIRDYIKDIEANAV